MCNGVSEYWGVWRHFRLLVICRRLGWVGLFFLGVLVCGGCKKKRAEPIDDLESMQPAGSRHSTLLRDASASGSGKRSLPRLRPVKLPSGAVFFGFDRGLEGWRGWGRGEGRRQVQMGHHNPGALLLVNVDGRRSYTFYRQVKGLHPGRYRVSAWLRALDVKKGQWDVSIWAFADGGKGIKSPVKNLKGTFGWSKLTYTIEVSGRSLGVWFRLKSQGQLWVDDVMIVPTKAKPIRYRFQVSPVAIPSPGIRGHGLRCQRCYRWWKPHHTHCAVCGGKLQYVSQHSMFATKPAPPARRVVSQKTKHPSRLLFDFEVGRVSLEQRFHPFRTYRNKATSGRRSAAFWYGKYNNIAMGSRVISDWSGYRYIALDVFNPLSRHVTFHLCVNDKKQSGYWDQLNHLARLAPGWNRLRFSLQQYVGERGSVRIQRFVNLSTIRRFWFAVGAEKKQRYSQPFLVDHIRLEQGPPPPDAFSGLYRFDFVAQRFRTQRGFLGVTPLHQYNRDVGFGFRNATIWRLMDSKYTDTLLRDAILSNQGEFVVDVPNGRYTVELYAKHLGLWYEHFWTHRKIEVNGKVLVNQKRSDANAYLRDLLQFQDMIPAPTDDAYSLYLQKLLSPYTSTVRVTNGRMVFRWKGDSSGVALNALVLFPTAKRKQGQEFLRRLALQQRTEFSQISRKLKPVAKVDSGAVHRVDHKRGFYAPLIHASSYVRYNWILRSRGRSIVMKGGWGQRPFQALMVRSFRRSGKLRISVSPLRSRRGVILPKQMLIRYGVNQFMGHEINHETYELAPRFLRTIPKDGITLPARQSLLVWFHIPLQKKMKAGTYRGFLTIKMHGKQIRYPIQLSIYPFHLPLVDIPVGYFGLDPVSFAYFKAPGVKSWLWRWRRQSLRILRDRGFSTWSSLPGARVQKQGHRLRVDTKDVDRLMRMARKLGFQHPVFTYGGSFLDSLLQIDLRDFILDMPQQRYRRASARVLRRILSKRSWLPVIYNYSDEASGYSQKVMRDLRRAAILKKYYPFLRRGGFTHSIKPGKYGYKLNQTMTDISLSSVRQDHIQRMRQEKKRWGFYNASIGSFEIGRSTFGEGLFAARLQGATHRLAWHWSGTQNYPYYDLDGRESDAMMVYPRTDGRLDVSLKLEWATQGLEDYRLLLLLQRLAKRAGPRGRKALLWIARNYREVNFFGSPNYLRVAEKRRTDATSQVFREKVYRMILRLIR